VPIFSGKSSVDEHWVVFDWTRHRATRNAKCGNSRCEEEKVWNPTCEVGHGDKQLPGASPNEMRSPAEKL